MQKLKPYLSGKRHIVWDWNGTLLNDIDCAVDAICVLLTEQGMPEISREEYLEKFSFPVMDYYKRVGFDFEKVSFEDLSHQFIKEYQLRLDKVEVHFGAKELLSEIHSSGLTQSVLSAAKQTHLEKQLGDYGLTSLFHNIYGLSDHYAHGKVDRGRELIKKVGISPTETILIGDTDHDLEVGKELGVDVVLLADGHQSYSRLKDIHHQVLKTRR